MVTVSVFLLKFISRVFPFVSGALEKRLVTKGESERLLRKEGVKKKRGFEFGSVFLLTKTARLFDTECVLLERNLPPKYLLQIKTGYWVLILMKYFVSIHTRSPHPQPVSAPKLFHVCEHFSSSY